MEDRIRFFEGTSVELELERRADVIISDLRGVLPFYSYHIPSIIDARERLLAPGGKMIPKRDVLRMALVDETVFKNPLSRPWLDNDLGLDLSAGYRHVVNTTRRMTVQADCVMSDPVDIATLDYATIDSPDARATCELTVNRSASVAGFVVWFDMETDTANAVSNGPDAPPMIYQQTFFPLEQALDLARGDRVEIDFAARFQDRGYMYSWESRVFRVGENDAFASFRQGTALSDVISPSLLQRPDGATVDTIRDRAEHVRHAMDLLQEGKPYSAVASSLYGQFGSRFETWDDAEAFVTRLRTLLE